MLLAKSHRRPPRQVAEAILAHLPGVDEIERAEVAGPSADALRVAAVSAVRGAAPFPFPPGIPPRPLVIRLPVEFRLR